jgi:sugar lactone lactonase YvrE
MKGQRLLRFDGDLTQVADLSAYTDSMCNDMVVDGVGRAYVGNFGFDGGEDSPIVSTDLLRVDPDGTVAVAATDLVFPNGLVISPDGNYLFVAETFASRISCYDVARDGSLSNRKEWVRFAVESDLGTIKELLMAGRILPDGIAGDAEGALWVADANGNGAIRVLDGEVVDKITTGERAVYAVALGGSDRRTLFLCVSPRLSVIATAPENSSGLLCCEVDVPGAGWP